MCSNLAPVCRNVLSLALGGLDVRWLQKFSSASCCAAVSASTVPVFSCASSNLSVRRKPVLQVLCFAPQEQITCMEGLLGCHHVLNTCNTSMARPGHAPPRPACSTTADTRPLQWRMAEIALKHEAPYHRMLEQATLALPCCMTGLGPGRPAPSAAPQTVAEHWAALQYASHKWDMLPLHPRLAV